MRRDPKENERRLLAIASEQGGYFTANQALSVGYTYRQQHFHRQRGNWILIDRGLFRLRDYPSSSHEDLIRWGFWSRDRKGKIRAVVSHESALAFHDLSDIMPAKLHLTVPKGFRKSPPGACMLHYAALADQEIEHHQGFQVTTPLRTIKDVAESTLSPEHLIKAVRDALSRGLIRRKQLEENGMSHLGRQRLTQAMEALA
ncbi:MAG: type IV toxin-antitoxin system AbiEi family antitoxin domain-containing protein [Candidatus Binatia bacterium]